MSFLEFEVTDTPHGLQKWAVRTVHKGFIVQGSTCILINQSKCLIPHLERLEELPYLPGDWKTMHPKNSSLCAQAWCLTCPWILHYMSLKDVQLCLFRWFSLAAQTRSLLLSERGRTCNFFLEKMSSDRNKQATSKRATNKQVFK